MRVAKLVNALGLKPGGRETLQVRVLSRIIWPGGETGKRTVFKRQREKSLEGSIPSRATQVGCERAITTQTLNDILEIEKGLHCALI